MNPTTTPTRAGLVDKLVAWQGDLGDFWASDAFLSQGSVRETISVFDDIMASRMMSVLDESLSKHTLMLVHSTHLC